MLAVAGVLLDYSALHDHRVRPLALLNDSKQLSHERREVPQRRRSGHEDRRAREQRTE